ncbi:hypothetical protein ABZX69_08610 [Streptomyces sp. NPDC004074]|uniref:hypothetical protein n=1 Tax=Streptomyces sp. NPDC004074 TaxID=3154277 RepID=UPI0033A662F6
MSVTRQYLLDTCRAAQRGEPAPPRPVPTTGGPCANCTTGAGSAPSSRAVPREDGCVRP